MIGLIKKLFIVGLLTLIGHLLSLLLYPVSTRYLLPEEVLSISRIDSAVMLLIGILSFGLNVRATRDIALSSNLTSILKDVQSSRITLAIIISFFGFLWVLLDLGRVEIGWVLISAPLFALNYDFALYGTGKPEWAAVVSLIRQALPLTIFIVAVLFNIGKPEHYLILLVMFVITSSWIIGKLLSTPLLYSPSRSFYKCYASAFLMGAANLILVFQRYGFIHLAESRIPVEEFIYLVTSLKVLLFMTGCKRMVIQAFYTRLIDDRFCNLLNLLCFIMTTACLIISIQNPELAAKLLFDNENATDYIILISAGTCSLLLFATSDAQLLLKRRDNWVFYSNFLSCGIFTFIICLDMKFLDSAIDYLYLLVSIELFLSILYKLSLHIPLKDKTIAKVE